MTHNPDSTEQRQDAPHVATVLRLASAMQRAALVLAVPVAVVAVVVWAVLRGGTGAVGGLVGAAIGLGVGLVGTLVMRWTARATPAGVMIAAMTSFAGKVLLLLVFLIAFRGTTLFDNRAFGISLMAVTVAYVAGEVIGFVRARIPAVDL